MTTSTNSAGGIGLPEEPFNAGRYLIAGNSINRLANGLHEAFVGSMPGDAELFIYVAKGLLLPVTITGPRGLVESWIAERCIY